MKVSVVLKLLRDDGWQLVRTKGSHRQFRHPVKKGLVTVVGKPSYELNRGTVASIFQQAGMK